MQVQEVQLLKDANALIEFFKEAYKARYNTEPVLEHPLPLTIFLKGLVRKFGMEKTRGLVKFYLTHPGDRDWWQRNGHSAAIFEKDIEVINAGYSLQTRGGGAKPATNDLRISIETLCPNCNTWFTVVCMASVVDKVAHTQWCEPCIDAFQLDAASIL